MLFRSEQQLAEVADEDFDGVLFRLVGLFAANFPLQAGDEEPGQSVPDALLEKLRVRMPVGHEELFRLPLHGVHVRVNLHANGPRPLAAIDGQHSVRRNFVQRLLEVVIVLEGVLADDLFLFLLLGLL